MSHYTHGSNRYLDLLVFDPGSNRAYIIDPTVRYESNEDVGQAVQHEKQAKYRTCTRDVMNRYPQYGRPDFEVFGLWVGSRGVIPRRMVDFFEKFSLGKVWLVDIAEKVLSASIRMVHHRMNAQPSSK